MKIGIVAFAFGTPQSVYSNLLIGNIAYNIAKETNGQVITQEDVRIERGVEVEYIVQEKRIPSTLRISYEAADWAKAREIKKIYVVAAEPHMERCLRDLRYSLSKAQWEAELFSAREVEKHSHWYYQESRQWHTRSARNWALREGFLMSLPMPIYELITF